ncbi:coagulation factor IXb [Stigmatopora nigra]
MAYMRFFLSWLLAFGLQNVDVEGNAGGVMVPRQKASQVLSRQRRYNSPFEEMRPGNMERECREEMCNFEEAREIFEDESKTMTFWAGYIDGDQCKPPPCKNGGSCEDGVNSYTCWCNANFTGKNCEIEIRKQCSVINGGCSHFCTMKSNLVNCRCPLGYRLGPDRRTCEAKGEFSCGQAGADSRLTPRTSNQTADDQPDEVIPDEWMDYEDEDVRGGNFTEDVRAGNATEASPSRRVRRRSKRNLMHFFPTIPTIMAAQNSDQRIVGGYEGKTGDVPWQVALISRSKGVADKVPFCGGSLLDALWVITAAHCIVEHRMTGNQFFVRLGEHDIDVHEGSERDHEVSQELVHKSYKFKKSRFNHDVALLKLATPVEMSAWRRPVCLGPRVFSENLLMGAATSVVSGWGRLRDGGIQSTRLRILEVPPVERNTCKASSQQRITPFMFCAGFRDRKEDACQGDSGGPHVTLHQGTWFLTGIISWGEGCAKAGKYGVYTRLSRYYPWISNATGIHMYS